MITFQTPINVGTLIIQGDGLIFDIINQNDKDVKKSLTDEDFTSQIEFHIKSFIQNKQFRLENFWISYDIDKNSSCYFIKKDSKVSITNSSNDSPFSTNQASFTSPGDIILMTSNQIEVSGSFMSFDFGLSFVKKDKHRRIEC
tara:strand:+ start:222 stop:650 length:429 start_codon:yes stop_codon:yes gene_type:complete